MLLKYYFKYFCSFFEVGVESTYICIQRYIDKMKQLPAWIFQKSISSKLHSSSCNSGCIFFFSVLYSNYLLYSCPSENLLSKCLTDLRNKLFYVRCTKELIIAWKLYMIACLYSGKLDA